MAQVIKAATPIWRLLSYLSSLLSVVLLAGGVWLAVRGAMGNTTMKLFGNEFSSTSVGVAMAFLGVALAASILHRILRSLDRVTGSEMSPPQM
jgi:DMSO/TMAO reductase YedYZ heme-binding membrane subunit